MAKEIRRRERIAKIEKAELEKKKKKLGKTNYTYDFNGHLILQKGLKKEDIKPIYKKASYDIRTGNQKPKGEDYNSAQKINQKGASGESAGIETEHRRKRILKQRKMDEEVMNQ